MKDGKLKETNGISDDHMTFDIEGLGFGMTCSAASGGLFDHCGIRHAIE